MEIYELIYIIQNKNKAFLKKSFYVAKKSLTLLPAIFRDPVGIRTQDPQLRRLLLYPAELPDQSFRLYRLGIGTVRAYSRKALQN